MSKLDQKLTNTPKPPPFKKKEGAQGPPPLKHTNHSECGVIPEKTIRLKLGPIITPQMVQNKLPIDKIIWLVPLDKLIFKSGKTTKGGFFFYTTEKNFFAVLFSATEGLQKTKFTAKVVETEVIEEDRKIVLNASFETEEFVKDISICLDSLEKFESGCGPWLFFWHDAICRKLHIDSKNSKYTFVSVNKYLPTQNHFSTKREYAFPITLCDLEDANSIKFPSFTLSLSDVISWQISKNKVTICSAQNDYPLIEIQELSISKDAKFLSVLQKMLPGPPALHDIKQSIGTFRLLISTKVKAPPGDYSMKIEEQSLVTLSKEKITFTHGFQCKDVTVLISESGQFARVLVSPRQGLDLLNRLKTHNRLLLTSNNELFAVCLNPELHNNPTKIVFCDNKILLGESNFVGINEIDNITIDSELIVVDWHVEGTKRTIGLFAPEKLGNKILEEWNVKRIEIGIKKAEIEDLYPQFDEVKKHNLLLILYGDILMLNRNLNTGMNMTMLIEKLATMGPVEFAEKKHIRNETVSKTMLLHECIPRIRQKFELQSAMYPYYIAQQDSCWLQTVFQNSIKTETICDEAKRIVPIVRQEIQSFQTNIKRPLSEIEMAIRPLSAILIREEVQKHWSTKVRQIFPAFVQMSLGGTLIAVSGGLAGWEIVGSTIFTQAGGGILGLFQKDKEAAAQIKNVAESVFQWWQVFMQVLVVSVYESAQFIDDQSAVTMNRDKHLLSQLNPEQEAVVKGRLQNQLRSRILEERKNRFLEILKGSGICIADLISDIENSVGPEMDKIIQYFAKSNNEDRNT